MDVLSWSLSWIIFVRERERERFGSSISSWYIKSLEAYTRKPRWSETAIGINSSLVDSLHLTEPAKSTSQLWMVLQAVSVILMEQAIKQQQERGAYANVLQLSHLEKERSNAGDLLNLTK